ncbi:transposase domain-containing protein [Streptomyces sp. MMS24-I2-30]|uniref:transposase domain-containing protein n=1 Tax=Streptomyces sp. MMS24-I2-30 TaxID=3351564 RepID=UPI003896D278
MGQLKSSAERLSDRVAVGVLTQVFPQSLVDEVLAETGRVQQRNQLRPARLVACFVLAMCLFSGQSYDERQPAGQGPLKAREITARLGLETSSAKVQGVRSKARRLAERGWLLLDASGAFSAGRRPVAVPDAGSSA